MPQSTGKAKIAQFSVRRYDVPASEEVLGWLRKLPGPVAVTYEAGPTAFGLGGR